MVFRPSRLIAPFVVAGMIAVVPAHAQVRRAIDAPPREGTTVSPIRDWCADGGLATVDTLGHDDNIVWGTLLGLGACGDAVADDDNIVWGTATQADDNIVWGTATGGAADDGGSWSVLDNIIWGTLRSDDETDPGAAVAPY